MIKETCKLPRVTWERFGWFSVCVSYVIVSSFFLKWIRCLQWQAVKALPCNGHEFLGQFLMNCNASLVCKSAKYTGDAMTGWVGKSWRWGGAIALSRHFGQPVRCGNKFKSSGAKITVPENTELPFLPSEIIIIPLFSSCAKNIGIFTNDTADLNMPLQVSVSI